MKNAIKTKKIVTLLVILVTTAISCVKEYDFLREQPKDAIFAENVYINYTGFQYASNALLALMRSARAEKGISTEFEGLMYKIGTDNAYANSNFATINPYARFNTQLNPDLPTILAAFQYYYTLINAANTIITRAENSEVDWEGQNSEENERNKNETIAYARFARAWAYRFLVFGWGEVPISKEEITGGNYRNDWERNTVEEVKRFILDDLLGAQPYLEDDSRNAVKLPKVLAQHYLAEIYLSLYNDDNGNTEALDSAYFYANKITSNTAYKLITARYGVRSNEPGVPFMDQFYDGNVQPAQGNTEVLWWWPNREELVSTSGSYENAMRRTWVPNYNSEWQLPYSPENGGRGVTRFALLPWALTIYEEQDDRFSEYAIRKYYLRYTNDGKISDTLWTDMGQPANWGVLDHARASTRKWDWAFEDETLWGQSFQYNDQPYLRLAETYLLMAEILFYKADFEGAAYWLNQIRTRSNATPVSSTAVTIDFILDERSRELITEEHRRITLVRTGKFYERTLARNPQVTMASDPPGLQEYHVRYPIPRSIIDANSDKLMPQNDGY